MKEYALIPLDNDTDENFYAICEGNRSLVTRIVDGIVNDIKPLDFYDMITGEKIMVDYDDKVRRIKGLSYSCGAKWISKEEAIDALRNVEKTSVLDYVKHIHEVKENSIAKRKVRNMILDHEVKQLKK